MDADKNNITVNPTLRTGIAVAGGVSFYILCMMLSLVGPAGSKVEHAGRNRSAFLVVLLLTLALAGLSTYLGMTNRKVAGGGMPRYSIGLCMVCVTMLIVLFLGGFAI